MKWWVSFQIKTMDGETLQCGNATMTGSDFLSTMEEFQCFCTLNASTRKHSPESLYCQILAIERFE